MRELTLEIPLLEVPLSGGTDAGLLANVLKRAESAHFLKIRSEGFLMICRVARKDMVSLKEGHRARPAHNLRMRVLSRDRSGLVLQISGAWQGIMDSRDPKAGRTLGFLKSVEREPIFSLRNPSFDGGMLRVPLVADEKTITRLLNGMKHARVPFRVADLGSPRVSEESPLEDLTARQANILRTAYTMGYYDVPKRARVEDIARLFDLDKGTVGEHLQRAEKNILDCLLLRY
jgi:hypothetical protein